MEITKEMLELAAAKANHAQLIVMYEAIKAERDALAAQVEVLRQALEPFGLAVGGLPSCIEREDYSVMHERVKDWFGVTQFKKAIEAYSATPVSCLAQVKADAGRAGFIAGAKVYGFNLEYVQQNADEYAESIRQEVK